uniref:Uncharacterized protein n=1 Tax=Aotus nancymaae TaxID=37293 RepID=A0A2K5D283_AOTNA
MTMKKNMSRPSFQLSQRWLSMITNLQTCEINQDSRAAQLPRLQNPLHNNFQLCHLSGKIQPINQSINLPIFQ